MAIEDLSYGDYWRIFRRRWRLAAAAAVLGAGAGVGMAHLQAPEPIYEATAVVAYNPQSGFELPGAPIEVGRTTDASAQILLIRSNQVLGTAAKTLGLIGEETERSDYDLHQPVLSRLADRFRVAVDARGRPGPMSIVAQADGREEAARIANAVTRAYRDENLYELTKHIAKRRQFIEQQLQENEQLLNEAQLDYELFRREHPRAAVEPGMQGAISDIARTEAAAQLLAEKVRETRRQISLVRSGRAPSDIGLQMIVGATGTARLQQLSAHYTKLNIDKARLLTELTELHPLVQQRDEQLHSARDDLEGELQLILDAFEKQQEEEEAKLEEIRDREKTLPKEAMHLAQLARKVKVYENIQLQLRHQFEDAILKEAGITGQVSVISAAIPPATPINPPAYAPYGTLGFMGGLFLGFVLGVLLESTRFSLQSLRDIEEDLDLAVLAINPAVDAGTLSAWIPGRRKVREDSAQWSRSIALSALLAPRSTVGEAFRTLRANLLPQLEAGNAAITVTASGPGEGSTTTAMNLALSFAQSGQRVLLVEADLRSPDVSSILGLQREPGLVDLLLGSCELQAATRSVADFVTGGLSLDEVLLGPGLDQFHVMPCGQPSEHSGELFGSEAFQAALERMRAAYDLVLFDAPPLRSVVDALVLARRCSALLVFDPTRSTRTDLEACVTQLRKAEAPLLGIFVNGMALDTDEIEPLAPEAAQAAS